MIGSRNLAKLAFLAAFALGMPANAQTVPAPGSPLDSFAKLTPSGFLSIPVNQLPFVIPDGGIPYLSNDVIKALKKEHVSSFSGNQVSYLTSQQIRSISTEAMDGIRPDQIAKMNNLQFKAMTPGQTNVIKNKLKSPSTINSGGSKVTDVPVGSSSPQVTNIFSDTAYILGPRGPQGPGGLTEKQKIEQIIRNQVQTQVTNNISTSVQRDIRFGTRVSASF